MPIVIQVVLLAGALLSGATTTVTVKPGFDQDDPYRAAFPYDGFRLTLVSATDDTVVREAHDWGTWKDVPPGKYRVATTSPCFQSPEVPIVVRGRKTIATVLIPHPAPERRFVIERTIALDFPNGKTQRAISAGAEFNVVRLFTDSSGACTNAVGRLTSDHVGEGQWLLVFANSLGKTPPEKARQRGALSLFLARPKPEAVGLVVGAEAGPDDPFLTKYPPGAKVTLTGPDGRVTEGSPANDLQPKFAGLIPGTYGLRAEVPCQPSAFEAKIAVGTDLIPYLYAVPMPQPERRFLQRDYAAYQLKNGLQVALPARTEVTLLRTWPNSETHRCDVAVVKVVDAKGVEPTGSVLKVAHEALHDSPVAGLTNEQFNAQQRAQEEQARQMGLPEVQSGRCTVASRQRYQTWLGNAVNTLEVLNRSSASLLVVQDQEIIVVMPKGEGLSMKSTGSSVVHVVVAGAAAVDLDLRSDSGHAGLYDPIGEQVRSPQPQQWTVARAIVADVGDKVQIGLKGYGCVGVLIFSSGR